MKLYPEARRQCACIEFTRMITNKIFQVMYFKYIAFWNVISEQIYEVRYSYLEIQNKKPYVDWCSIVLTI